MFLSLLQRRNITFALDGINDNAKKSWTCSWTTSIEARDIQVNHSLANVEKYCRKLKNIIGNDESQEDGSWVLATYFHWSRSNPERMHVKLSGRLLERLYQLCGENMLLSLEANLVHSPGGRNWGQRPIKLTTAEMGIFSPSTMYSGPQQLESGTLEGGLNQETFCEDIHGNLSNSLVDATDSDTLTGSFAIILKIEGEYINFDGILFDKLSACKSIFRNGVHSDISIVAADGTLIPSHKCFLSTHSSVLKVMLLQENFEEAKSNQIKMDDVSKDCVMALLEFLYTWEITAALRSSELAVELFQVAHKYDIKPLEYKLADMFLKRENQWFAVDASIELFCFAKKIEANSAELKVKAVQALKSNSEGLLNSKTFKTLFTEDWETAMELCALSLQSI